jgi:hypothetical protein
MKILQPEISWHESDNGHSHAIYACAFHPVCKNILATAGFTGIIRVS